MTLQIAQRWFEIRRISDDITLLWEPHVIPLMRCNIWHVRGRDRDLVIDTGMGIVDLRPAIAHLIDKPVTAVATHTHADHIGSHHEFADCLVHRLEAADLAEPSPRSTLVTAEFAEGEVKMLRIAGYEIGETLITALPHAGYKLASYSVRPARPTRIVEQGHVVDLGDRSFEVLHLPGHSPGSMGLWEKRTGTLFSGDAIYDGPLLDELEDSNIADYVQTMRRLRELPVNTVHAGHDPSFGRTRLIELVDAYLARRDPGYSAAAS
jgi:glyoxylase-like metal-dependent hydrolase (beta-lactamase superfamily II)